MPFTMPPAPSPTAYVQTVADAPQPEDLKPHSVIGMASLLPDGTLIIDGSTRYKDGSVVDDRTAWSTDNPNYKKVLTHLGGLKPGERKPVYNDWSDFDKKP